MCCIYIHTQLNANNTYNEHSTSKIYNVSILYRYHIEYIKMIHQVITHYTDTYSILLLYTYFAHGQVLNWTFTKKYIILKKIMTYL